VIRKWRLRKLQLNPLALSHFPGGGGIAELEIAFRYATI
jgi:hypothetical protein